MAETYHFKRRDTGPSLVITLTRNRQAVDLTNASSARLLMHTDTEDIEIALNFVSPRTSGQVIVVWADADTDVSGDYEAEVEVTDNAGKIETFPNAGYRHIQIENDLA